ncbi:MAG TPA: ABC transporter ATP-binding protein, partial [Caulobacteraceae bacterium]|nr:ABC transporter ATP-binding protein [Caulobacteraceae bacterium]
RMAARAPTQVREEAPPPPPAPVAKPMPPGPMKRRLEAAEEVLARCTRTLEDLDRQLAELYAKDPAKAADLAKRRDKAQAQLDDAEAKWMAAAEAYEAAVKAYA